MAQKKPAKKAAKPTGKTPAKKSAQKSSVKPAVKTKAPKAAAKTAAKAPAKKSASKSASKPAAKSAGKAKAPAKSAAKAPKAKSAKSTVKPTAKAGKAAKSSVAKTVAKTAGKIAAAGAALGAVGAVAFAGLKLAKVTTPSKGKTDVASMFSPLDDRLIIEEMKTELRTPGGLFIPDTVSTEEGPKHGIVLAVGRGLLGKKGRIRPLDVKTGDTVLFESYMGSPLKIGDRDVVIMRESQLLGVLNS